MDRAAQEYRQNKSKNLELSFVKYADLLLVEDGNEETDREGFYVIPETGNSVIGRFLSLKDMENETPNIIVRETVYYMLCEADRALKRKAGYESCQIVVTYGYRSPEIQEYLFDMAMKQRRQENPNLSELDLIEMVHREIAHPQVAGHPTGGAVDVTIFDYEKKQFLEFGTEICEFGSKDIYYAARYIKPIAKKNRRILRTIMCQQGFAPYDGEWWHFCYGDKEWAYYTYKHQRKVNMTPLKALYQQKEYDKISRIVYNEKFKTNVSKDDKKMCIRLAVQKNGRLTEETLSILKKSGIIIERDKGGFRASSENFPLEILFVRDDDISKLVDAGSADIGIVGENIYREKGSNSIIKRYLGFGKCFLALAIRKDSTIKTIHDLSGKRIATSYRKLTEDFFKEKGVIDVEIVDIEGSVEIAPDIDYADAIVDLVSTGSSLYKNKLKVFCNIFNSQSILIENRDTIKNKEKNHIVSQLIQRIDCYLISKRYKCVTMMVPDSELSEVVKIITSLKNGKRDYTNDNEVESDISVPAICPIYGTKEKWFSIQTVLELTELWGKIDLLKKHDVKNILFYDIEGIIS